MKVIRNVRSEKQNKKKNAKDKEKQMEELTLVGVKFAEMKCAKSRPTSCRPPFAVFKIIQKTNNVREREKDSQ